MRFHIALTGALLLAGCTEYTSWDYRGVHGATWTDPRYPPQAEDVLVLIYWSAPVTPHDTLSKVTMAWENYDRWYQRKFSADRSLLEDLAWWAVSEIFGPRGTQEAARVGLMNEVRRLGGDAVIYGRRACAVDVPDGSSDSEPGHFGRYKDLSAYRDDCYTHAWENREEGYQPGWWLWEAHVIRFLEPQERQLRPGAPLYWPGMHQQSARSRRPVHAGHFA